MHLAPVCSLSTPSSFSALVHEHRVQLCLWMLPPFSLFFFPIVEIVDGAIKV
jgi:hypothetical protein